MSTDIALLALEEYLLTSTEYFPLDNVQYLEMIKKQSITEKCSVDIDSLKAKFYVPNNYNSGSISKYKLRSIYLDILISCYSNDERTVYLIKLERASNWASKMIDKYYGFAANPSVLQGGNISDVKGLPFLIRNVKSVKQLEDITHNTNPNGCIKYLKISPVYEFDNYHYVEIINGCTERGQNKTLYVFRKYKNRFIIDNKIMTEDKY